MRILVDNSSYHLLGIINIVMLVMDLIGRSGVLMLVKVRMIFLHGGLRPLAVRLMPIIGYIITVWKLGRFL